MAADSARFSWCLANEGCFPNVPAYFSGYGVYQELGHNFRIVDNSGAISWAARIGRQKTTCTESAFFTQVDCFRIARNPDGIIRRVETLAVFWLFLRH